MSEENSYFYLPFMSKSQSLIYFSFNNLKIHVRIKKENNDFVYGSQNLSVQ